MSLTKHIGIITGQGDLPQRIIAQCLHTQTPVHAIAFEGQTPKETVDNIPHTWTKLGQVGSILKAFKSNNVTHIVMAGAIRRPSISELSLDWEGTKLLARIGLNKFGDDKVLSFLISFLEEQGFKVLGANEILDDLLISKGSHTQAVPNDEDLESIQRGVKILEQMGQFDIGQALVIQQGIVLGLEAIEGTAQLISRVKEYARPGRGGILVKMTKPGQNLKVDLPTIGLETVEQALNSGLVGIAVEAGATQFLNRENALKLANDKGLFVYGFSKAD